jgi:hypothetical protein
MASNVYQRAKQQTPELPWCQDSAEVLGSTVTQFVERNESYIGEWGKRWYENFQFIYGNQSIMWSEKYGVPVDYDFARRANPSVNEQSQTNISRTVFEALKALIFASLPDWDVATEEESHRQGKRFQKICQQLLDCYSERVGLEDLLDEAAGVFTAFGMVAGKVSYDYSRGGIRSVPKMEQREITVQTSDFVETPQGIVEIPTIALDAEGNPQVETRLVEARDAKGAVIFETKWQGDLRIDVLTPFEYRRDITSPDPNDAKFYQHLRIMDYDDFLREYDEHEGRTRFYREIKPGLFEGEGCYKFALKQYMRMAFVTPVGEYGRTGFGAMTRYKQDLQNRKVLVIEHYDRPTPDKWPQGRKLVVVNGYCTHISTPQYQTKKPGGWHPFAEASWLKLAPSGMPTSPLNDIIAKNKELNRLDSLIDTATLRNLGSMLLVKSGSGLDPQRIFGEPGQIHEVPNVLDVARWVRDDQPIPPAIDKLRQIKKDDSYEISGAQDALRGDRSKGVTSGYMLKQLQEREEARLAPARRRFERWVSVLGEKAIACIRANADKLGEDVFGSLQRSAAGEFTPSDIQTLLRTPIDFGVDVRVEPGSMLAKSKASIQATLIDIVQKTPAGGRLENPAVLDKFLKYFDADLLRDQSALHRDRATKENEKFADLGQLGPSAVGVTIPMVMAMDDDLLHIQEHEAEMIERAEELQSNPFELELRLSHIEWHRAQHKQKQGQLVAGTSATFPQTYAQYAQVGPANAAQVMQRQQQYDQAKMQQQAQQQTQPQPPQGPRGQKQAPGQPGPAPIAPGTPSANTPPAAQGGPG